MLPINNTERPDVMSETYWKAVLQLWLMVRRFALVAPTVVAQLFRFRGMKIEGQVS
ncbi:hypothetical protein [Paenibacillus sp. PL91]|uniref:hypothetical protein n=1 Tax=Paenibacillus sp. PL91 TaxID=2729538 RepID=UPI00145DB17F|nr:hypothetical protein [Paenibacillus sp. PL91]MBC9198787.1 hypothetical protein [Paenibacillus sp. PL91]